MTMYPRRHYVHNGVRAQSQGKKLGLDIGLITAMPPSQVLLLSRRPSSSVSGGPFDLFCYGLLLSVCDGHVSLTVQDNQLCIFGFFIDLVADAYMCLTF